MNVRKPKLGVFLLVLSAVCVVLKLLISYLFPLSRLLLIVLVPIAAVCLVVFLAANRHALKSGRVLAGILVPAAALAFTFLPIDSRLEQTRFHAAKDVYESAVRQVEENTPASDGRIVTGRFQLRFPQSLVTPYGWVDYCKMGDSVAVLFPASETLSVVRYYAYFSDPTARDLLEHPRKYGRGDSVSGVDRIDELDGPHWGYVLTWGDGRMVPEDPYL